jgi:hypothetical protein
MKNVSLLGFLLLQCFFYSCSNDQRKESGPSENNIDAARNFIRAALDGKFDEARKYMLPDSVNTQYMDAVQRNYSKMNKDTANSYRGSTIRIFSPVVDVNDSTTIVVYANSFKNDRDTLKVIRKSGQWLVDLKYLFEHDLDSTSMKPSNRDSIK